MQRKIGCWRSAIGGLESEWSDKLSELFLVRHAQASFGADNYDQLSDLGMRQSRWLGEHFLHRGVQFDRAIVGDMQRHHQTLDGICEGMGWQDSRRLVLPGLNEYSFVDLMQSFVAQNPEHPLIDDLAADPTNKQKHFRLLRVVLSAWGRDKLTDVAETWQVFSHRVRDAREQIQALARRGEAALAIGSGGSNSTFMGQVLNAPVETIFDLNLQSKNTGISRYFYNNRKISLTQFNAVPHLEVPEFAQYVTFG